MAEIIYIKQDNYPDILEMVEIEAVKEKRSTAQMATVLIREAVQHRKEQQSVAKDMGSLPSGQETKQSGSDCQE